MEEIIKFNNQTSGRDKLFRFTQYTCRFLWYNLYKRGADPKVIKRLQKVDETLSLMRRLLRFGRVIESFGNGSLISSASDRIIRVTSSLSRISNVCFMFIDHVVCLDKVKILPSMMIDSAKWDNTSGRFWLYSISLSLIRDCYEITKIFKEKKLISKRLNHVGSNSSSDLPDKPSPLIIIIVYKLKLLMTAIVRHSDLAIDMIKNFCDLMICISGLGYFKLSPGTVGMFGMIGTVAGTLPQINPMLKIVPAV